MLSDTKLNLLKQLAYGSTNDELIWAKGYLAGFLDAKFTNIDNSTLNITANLKPIIVYGTETGNSKKVASQILAGFKKEKIQAKTVDVFQFDVSKLEKENLVLFIMSTQGEGEFPQNAVNFYDQLVASTKDLSHLSFAVFGLGDTSYPLFCQAAILLDKALEEKNAKRILPLVKADVDYKSQVIQWENDLNIALGSGSKELSVIQTTHVPTIHKKNYKGTVKHKIILNDVLSKKQTYHIEIASEENISYEPGDSLGVYPQNRLEDMHEILKYFEVKPEAKINIKEESKSALSWLTELNIKGLTKKSIGLIAKELNIIVDVEKADAFYILKLCPKPDEYTFKKFITSLNPIAPRLYSISSSSEAHDGEVHLTVSLNKFNLNGEEKTGLASQFLADLSNESEIDFYIHKNENFRLPTEDQNIIMIGPGTGIAPFRSFIAERDVTNASGKNWLFFGEQHFTLDFYYQTEIQEWISTGVINKLDTAFSRDQSQKIYVQDRIRQKAKDFNEWLEKGANIYVCGQKKPMSIDVHKAITDVLIQERGISIEAAEQILEEMEANGKYQKDVY